MTAAELKHIVGERVFRSFYPQGELYNLDAEDRDELPHLGTTDQGEDIEINKRAAESDLLVYVNVNLVAMDGGHKSVADRAGVVQVAAAPPQRQDDGALALVHGPQASPHLHHSAWRMGRLLADHLKVFQIETTLNNDVFPSPYDFLHEARVGVVVKRPGLDARRPPRAGGRAAEAASTRCSTTCARRTG